jgi:hypothetical protein
MVVAGANRRGEKLLMPRSARKPVARSPILRRQFGNLAGRSSPVPHYRFVEPMLSKKAEQKASGGNVRIRADLVHLSIGDLGSQVADPRPVEAPKHNQQFWSAPPLKLEGEAMKDMLEILRTDLP